MGWAPAPSALAPTPPRQYNRWATLKVVGALLGFIAYILLTYASF
ncbi:MAG: hypothetical protein N3E49_07980 [Bacteroidia bacterium]|nr:hypothetical protein [Bacteroidia bacterium]